MSREHLDKVLSYIQLGQADGDKLLTGGHRLTDGPLADGNYVAPTVFADVENGWRISQEEIFGPVQVIAPFDDVDEAIALANDSRYGLAGMTWTSSLDTAHQVAREVRTGTMWVNCFFVRDLRAPFGGMKDSGIGREGGLHSEEFFTEAKAVVIQSRLSRRPCRPGNESSGWRICPAERRCQAPVGEHTSGAFVPR